MKFLQIITLIFIAINLYSQEKIQIIGIDNSISEYSIEEIKDISFNLENSAVARVTNSENSVTEIHLNNQTTINFENDMVVFRNDNQDESFVLKNISKITFEAQNSQTNYPFGELVVDEVLVDGLNNPWGLDFLDNDNIIFTEHDGRLFKHNISSGQTDQITGLPAIPNAGQGGLLDVTVSPDFNNDGIIYIAYAKTENWEHTLAIGKGKLEGTNLVDFKDIFIGNSFDGGGQHFGSRIVFDDDGHLYFSIGDRGRPENAQDSTNHYGSVLRINPDGSVPNDNPYLDAPGAQPELYTMGNRNIQGMFYLDQKDEVWAIEHGPRGGDELNIIQAGKNYSWPLATYGINYNGTPITEVRSIPGHIDPITYWVPSIAPCGMDFVSYNAENDELDVVIATLVGQHLHRVRIVNNEVVETVRSLNGYARFRDVQLSPDGYLYAATQSPGRIIRLKSKD